MQTCPKCGTQFEGKSCPECGAEYRGGEKCPKCGAQCEDGAKFCPSCGYSLIGRTTTDHSTPYGEKMRQHNAARRHKVLNIMPSALLGLFSVLALIFFSLPTGFAGSLFGEQSCGSVYEIFGGYVSVIDRGAATAALIFGLCGLPAACASALFTFANINGSAQGRYAKVIFECFGYAIYAAFIVISAIMLAQISSANSLAMQTKPGAATILLLVFAATFGVASAVCRIVDKFVLSKQAELKDARAPYKYKKSIPVCPKCTSPKYVATCFRSNISSDICNAVFNHKKAMRFTDVLLPISFVAGLTMIILSFLTMFNIYLPIQSEYYALPVLGTVIPFVIWLFATIVAAITIIIKWNKKMRSDGMDYNFAKANQRRIRLIVYTIISAVLLAVALVRFILGIVCPIYPTSTISEPALFVLVLYIFLFNLIVCMSTFSKAAAANMALLGQKRLKGGVLTEEGKKFVNADNKYIASNMAYKAYLKEDVHGYYVAHRNCIFEQAMCDSGLDYKNHFERAAFRIERNRKKLLFITLASILLIVLAVVVCAVVLAH